MIALGIAAVGVFRVAPDERLLVRRGAAGPVTTYGPGWHWRVPFAGERISVPAGAVALARDVALRSREGAQLTVHVTGRFALAAGDAARYVPAGSQRSFAEVVTSALEGALAPRADDLAGGAPVDDPLRAAVTRSLAEVGLEVSDLAIEVPRESNPALVAQARREAETLAAAGPHHKLLMVGWDAADWLLIKPLMAAGRMPNLARLVNAGAHGDLRSEIPLFSPVVWTTIATGKPMSQHGVLDFLVRDPASGTMVPVASTARRVHALWTILSALGRPSDVVGYWATWPAEPIVGTMVSDRVAYQLFGFGAGDSGEGMTSPPQYWDTVKRLKVTADRITWADVRRFIDVDEGEFQRAWDSLPPERRHENKINHLRKILAATRTYQAIALDLLAHQTDLTIVYFEGTDTIAHLFARALPPRLPVVTDEEVRKFGHAVPEYYVYIDELLGQLLAKADPDTVVMVLSDHGFFTGALRPDSDPSDLTRGGADWHRLAGIVVAAGPGVQHATIADATILDIAPTALAVLGLPVPKDFPGHVLPQLLPPGGAPATGVLASYEALPRPRPPEATRSAASDRERMQELAALGYISPGEAAGGGTATPAAGSPAPVSAAAPALPAAAPPAPSGVDPSVLRQQTNLAWGLVRRGDIVGGRKAALAILAADPSYGPAYLVISSIEFRAGRPVQEFEALAAYFTRSAEVKPELIPGMVDAARRGDRLQAAAALLDQLRGRLATTADFHVGVGLVNLYQKRTAEALPAFEQALAINPLNFWAVKGKSETLKEGGRTADARATVEDAARRAQAGGSRIALEGMAAVALDEGWPELAEPMLRQVLAADPDNGRVVFTLGLCLARQRRPGEALPLFRKAIEVDPTNLGAVFELGIALTASGSPGEGLAQLERAERGGMDTAGLHVGKARAYAALHDPAKASAELDRALAIEPGNAEAAQLAASLRGRGAGAR